MNHGFVARGLEADFEGRRMESWFFDFRLAECYINAVSSPRQILMHLAQVMAG